MAHAAITASPVHGAIGSFWRLVVLWIARPAVIGASCSTCLWKLNDVTAERLIDAVRVIAAGDALLAPGVTRRLIGEFAQRQVKTAQPSPALEELTPRETEVLQLLAEGLSNSGIATRLVVTEETVKTHVSRILNKLGLRDRTQAVVAAYESVLVVPGSRVQR